MILHNFLRNAKTRVFQQARTALTLRQKANPPRPEQLYEPDIVDTRLYPEFDQVNIRLQGFDYGPLESYQAYVHRMARHFKFKVDESYAVAFQSERVTTLKQNSTVVDSDVELRLYDRWVRLSGVSAVRLQLFVDLLRTNLPSGVRLTAKAHEKADENLRYIPDLLLKAKQDELKGLDDPIVRRNLGWE